MNSTTQIPRGETISQPQAFPEQQRSPPPEQASEKNWIRYLPMMLRGVGALAVLASLYTFLAQGWESSSDLVRYLFLLGHTAVLAIIGLGSAKLIKEAKGARLLLILALVSVPINFAILGAFIFAGDNLASLAHYPSYMSWSVGSLNTALILTAAAMLVMLPVTALGYKVLVRNVYRQSTLFFLISNIILLVPFRQPELVAFFAMIAGACLLAFHRMMLRKDLSFKTVEGKIAFGLQFLPVMILLGRSFWLYSFDTILLGSSALIAFIAIRQITLAMSERSSLRIALEAVSIGLTLICAVSFGLSLIMFHFSGAWIIAIMTLIAGSMAFELSLRGQLRAPGYRIFATLIIVTGLLANFILFDSPLAALICLAVGAGMMATSYVFQQKALFIGAVILMGVGLYYQFAHLMHFFQFNYWIALASMGILSIVGGSYLEANAARIKQWLRTNKQALAQWDY